MFGRRSSASTDNKTKLPHPSRPGRFSIRKKSALLALLMPLGIMTLSACSGSSEEDQKPKAPVMSMETVQVDQVSKLGNKIPDGQYLVTRVAFKNLDTKSRVLDPSDFALQNETEDEKLRYSQPCERLLSNAFMTDYGQENRDKLIDMAPVNAYPQLPLERYFVFMVPADASPKQYRIFYKPLSLAAPLVSGKTILNDNRYATASPASQPQY